MAAGVSISSGSWVFFILDYGERILRNAQPRRRRRRRRQGIKLA